MWGGKSGLGILSFIFAPRGSWKRVLGDADVTSTGSGGTSRSKSCKSELGVGPVSLAAVPLSKRIILKVIVCGACGIHRSESTEVSFVLPSMFGFVH